MFKNGLRIGRFLVFSFLFVATVNGPAALVRAGAMAAAKYAANPPATVEAADGGLIAAVRAAKIEA